MRQLVPCLRKRPGERVEVTDEFVANFTVRQIDLQRDVACHHHQVVHLAIDMRIGGLWRFGVRGCPLDRASRTPDLFSFECEQIFEVAVVPLCGVRGPAAVDAVGHRILREAGTLRVLPAKAHCFDRGDFRRRADFVG